MDFFPPIQIPHYLQPYISNVWYAATPSATAIPIYADGQTGIIFQQSGMTLKNQEKTSLIPLSSAKPWTQLPSTHNPIALYQASSFTPTSSPPSFAYTQKN